MAEPKPQVSASAQSYAVSSCSDDRPKAVGIDRAMQPRRYGHRLLRANMSFITPPSVFFSAHRVQTQSTKKMQGLRLAFVNCRSGFHTGYLVRGGDNSRAENHVLPRLDRVQMSCRHPVYAQTPIGSAAVCHEKFQNYDRKSTALAREQAPAARFGKFREHYERRAALLHQG